MRRNCFIRLCQTLSVFLFVFFAATLLSAQPMEPNKAIDESHPGVRLIIGSEKLYDKIRLVQPRVAPLGKLKRGQVQVQNISNKKLNLKYRFEWFDTENFRIGDEEIWEEFFIGANGLKSFISVGTSPKASTMQFTVRLAGDK